MNKSWFATLNESRSALAVLVGLLIAVVWIQPSVAAGPVLTGRWGDARLPQELISPYASRPQAMVVVTLSTSCPLARRLIPHLNELRQEFGQDIQFVALFPNGSDGLKEIAEYAVATNLSWPVYKDEKESPWHQRLGLTTTPAVAVLDTREGFDDTVVFYRGQVNGMWAGGGTSGGQRAYLADALSRFLEGVPPELSETAASGCNISSKVYRDLQRHSDVTYHRDITRFIRKRCVSCHREGEPGAELFSEFDSYETVASMSKVMLARIEHRLMPPWHATTEEPSWFGGFKNDPRLSDDEIDLFRAWVERGCPPGDPKDAPPASDGESSDEWKIGEPDFVFQMPEAYQVPTSRLNEYQYYRVAANFPEDRYIQAIEMRPGNKSVVHHMAAIIGPATNEPLTGTKALLRLYGVTGDKVRKVGDWIAGDPFNARTYPDGYALKLPAKHDIFFEMHYTPTGQEEKPDISKMGIIWADEKPEHVLHTKIFNRKRIRLRPHDGHVEKVNYYQFPHDVLIYALAPHMHFRGKDFTIYRVTDPQTDQEKRQLILRISAYDFNWQRTYELERPILLQAGEALYSVTHFDNSHFNPHNPDPAKYVRYGLQSEDEMLNLRVKFERVDGGEVGVSWTP